MCLRLCLKVTVRAATFLLPSRTVSVARSLCDLALASALRPLPLSVILTVFLLAAPIEKRAWPTVLGFLWCLTLDRLGQRALAAHARITGAESGTEAVLPLTLIFPTFRRVGMFAVLKVASAPLVVPDALVATTR